MNGCSFIAAGLARRTNTPASASHWDWRSKCGPHEPRQRRDEGGMTPDRGNANVIPHTRFAGELPVLDIQFDQRFRMFRDKGNGNHDQALTLGACPPNLCIRRWADPFKGTDAALVANDVVLDRPAFK